MYQLPSQTIYLLSGWPTSFSLDHIHSNDHVFILHNLGSSVIPTATKPPTFSPPTIQFPQTPPRRYRFSVPLHPHHPPCPQPSAHSLHPTLLHNGFAPPDAPERGN